MTLRFAIDMRNGCIVWSVGLGVLSVLVLVLFAAQWRQLKSAGLLARIAMISSYDDAMPVLITDQARRAAFYRQISDARMPAEGEAGISELLETQQWLGNQVSKVEVPPTGRGGAELLALARAGGGLACEQMALIFRDLLLVQGMAARKVQLYRSNFEPMDTHVLVEVRLGDGQWVALDPTFNLTFHDEAGLALGVAEIRERLAGPGSGVVTPRYHGDRLYPANIEDYYLDWRVLFANAYVVSGCPDCSFLARLPPFRFWHGPVRYAFGEDIGALAEQHNRQYFTITVVYPMLFFGLLFAALLRAYSCRAR